MPKTPSQYGVRTLRLTLQSDVLFFLGLLVFNTFQQLPRFTGVGNTTKNISKVPSVYRRREFVEFDDTGVPPKAEIFPTLLWPVATSFFAQTSQISKREGSGSRQRTNLPPDSRTTVTKTPKTTQMSHTTAMKPRERSSTGE